MVNVEQFLLKQNIETGTYALVKYEGKIEATHFTKYNFGNSDWFLESPCELCEICEVNRPIDEFCKEVINEYIDLEEGENKEEYIEKFIKPMVFNGCFYEIENFQCSPYLPKEVDNIKIISKQECLEYMLQCN